VATVVVCLFLFQRGLVERIVTTSYGDRYGAYQMSLSAQLWILFDRAGIIFSVAALVGVMLAIARKNLLVIMCVTAAVISFFAFARTQAPSIQHTLPVFFWLFVVAAYPVVTASRFAPRYIRFVLVLVALLYLGLNFCWVFVPEARDRMQRLSFAFSGQTVFPLKIEHFSNYKELIRAVHLFNPSTSDLAVFASSYVLSDSLLYAIDKSLYTNITWASQVDLRDHMRIQELRATYAIVAEPITTHLPDGTQLVVSIPAASILAGTNLGAGYEKVAGPLFLPKGIRHIYTNVFVRFLRGTLHGCRSAIDLLNSSVSGAKF
jgi:hypothetical protein